jgi:hypothetical protein
VLPSKGQSDFYPSTTVGKPHPAAAGPPKIGTPDRSVVRHD